MHLLLLACSGPDPVDSADDTGSEWEHLTVTAEPFVAVTQGFAVGVGGRVVAIDGEWTALGGTLPEGVRAADERDGALWAVGSGGLSKWNGGDWDTVALPAETQGDTLVVRGDGSVAVLYTHMDCDDCEGDIVSNDLLVWDGSTWTEHEPPLSPYWFTALAELDDGTLVAAGSAGVGFWDGAAWDVTLVPDLWAADLVSDGDAVLAVGAGGVVVRGTAGALTTEFVGSEDLVAASTRDGVTWLLGASAAWADDDGVWIEAPLDAALWVDIVVSDGAVAVGWDSGPVGVLGATDGFLEVWREASLPLGSAWVDGDGAAWCVGAGAGRWDDTLAVWTLDDDYRTLSGSGPSDIVAVGGATIAEWDGSSWTVTDASGNGELWDVAVAPDGAAFAVGTRYGDEEGGAPILFSRSEGAWVQHTDAPTAAEVLVSAVAFAADDVYVLGWPNDELLHWDGVVWTAVATEIPGDPVHLWGRAGDDLYLGGDGMYHWDGAVVEEVVGAPAGIHDISGDDEALLISGTDGWGDAYAPFVTELRAGVWTELFRGDDGFVIAAGGGVQVVFDGAEGWRRGR
jgi:hypothetical protein